MVDTTCMRDSIVGDAWIQEMCRLNPVQRVVDPATGLPNGNILTGPVRLTFVETLLTAGPKMKSDPKSAIGYAASILFTPYTDLAIFWEEYWKICGASFASDYNATTGQYHGLDIPLVDQALKANKYSGYTPGLMTTNLSSTFKPLVCDTRLNPIVDPAKVYPGVWAICAVNSYASGVGKPRKGPRFGLVQVMIIGDDKPLSGGAPDPKQTFAATNVKPPAVMPSAGFGTAPPPSGGPPSNVGTFYPPSHNAAPGAPAPSAPLPPPPPGGEEDMSQFM